MHNLTSCPQCGALAWMEFETGLVSCSQGCASVPVEEGADE